MEYVYVVLVISYGAQVLYRQNTDCWNIVLVYKGVATIWVVSFNQVTVVDVQVRTICMHTRDVTYLYE